MKKSQSTNDVLRMVGEDLDRSPSFSWSPAKRIGKSGSFLPPVFRDTDRFDKRRVVEISPVKSDGPCMPTKARKDEYLKRSEKVIRTRRVEHQTPYLFDDKITLLDIAVWGEVEHLLNSVSERIFGPIMENEFPSLFR